MSGDVQIVQIRSQVIGQPFSATCRVTMLHWKLKHVYLAQHAAATCNRLGVIIRETTYTSQLEFYIPIRSGIRGPQVCQSRDCYVLPSLNIVDLFIYYIINRY